MPRLRGSWRRSDRRRSWPEPLADNGGPTPTHALTAGQPGDRRCVRPHRQRSGGLSGHRSTRRRPAARRGVRIGVRSHLLSAQASGSMPAKAATTATCVRDCCSPVHHRAPCRRLQRQRRVASTSSSSPSTWPSHATAHRVLGRRRRRRRHRRHQRSDRQRRVGTDGCHP